MTRTLLIVDDVRSNRSILRNMLEGDYRLLEAENGEQALAIMDEAYEDISAVLLDLSMPLMDGFEVLAAMQNSDRLSMLPVIVTTGQTDTGSEERALSLGAKDYISKPYKSAIIKQRIRNTINLRETAAAVNTLQRDRLTGAWNRDAFFQKAAALINARPAGYYVMGCVDIDSFKVVNDRYGNDMGDKVLRSVAGALIRASDTYDGICGRVFADCFIALYPKSVADEGKVTPQLLEEQINLSTGLSLTLSVGRYIVTDKSLSPSAMLDRASLAKDAVKGRYDVHIGVYDETMRNALVEEQRIVSDMNTALVNRQFEVWYQPQYNHETGALIGAEALVRWNHPQRGMLQPDSFIPVFERNGFIYALDKYVWEEACRFLRTESDEGHAPLPVSVNISRYDVFRTDFVEHIEQLVKTYGITADLLHLEITESAFAEATKRIVTVVRQLTKLGFVVEIDDFGSGYSSLNTLKNVPAQVLKLDMHFLEDDDDAQRGGNIVESVVRMTKWLGMSIIAEGVETGAQADYLRSVGCSYVQGFLYAKPMPAVEYAALCRSEKTEPARVALQTVENLDNDVFWNPNSMDTLIFNSYVGAACVYEYHAGGIELLRVTKKYAQVVGGAGMSVKDALKLNWLEHLDEKNKKKLQRDLDELIKERTEITGEYTFFGLPGCPEEMCLRSTMRVIASTGGRHLIYCISENITAQRMAEKREREASEMLQAVMDNVACGITAVVQSGSGVTSLMINDRYYDLLGYTAQQYADELQGDTFRMIYPEDRLQVTDAVNFVFQTGESRTLEYRAVCRDGTVIWFRSYVSLASFDGISGAVQLSTYTDITEQKQAEIVLRNTTQQLRTMMDDIPGGFARIRLYPDGAMRPVYINEGLCRLTGMPQQQFMSVYENDALAGVHPDDVSIVRKAVEEMISRGEARSARYRLINAEGDYVWLRIFGRVSTDEKDDTYLNIYYSDAGEQIRTEQMQKELLDNLPYGVALYEYDGKVLSVIHLNKRYWQLVDREPGTDYQSNFLNAVYPEDRTIISRELDAAVRGRRDISCDLRVRYGSDAYRPFHVVGHIQRRIDGKYAIYAVYTPISKETMSIQEMLPIALSAMMDNQTGFSFVKDKDLRYICCSHEMANQIGLPSDKSLLGQSDAELLGGSAISEALLAEDRHVMETGESIIDVLNQIPSFDGTVHYASTSKFPLKDSAGNIVGIYGVGRDVTETRQMQSRLELLTNNIPGGIAMYEGTLDALDKIRLTYFSDRFCQLFGFTREEYQILADTNPLGLVADEDISGIYDSIRALVLDGVPMDCIYRAHTNGGETKWIHVKADMGEPNGEKLTVDAVFFDITEHQEALEKLRISEEENRLALAHSKSVVGRYDVNTMTLQLPSENMVFGTVGKLFDVPHSQVEEGFISSETAKAYTAFYTRILRGEKNGEATFQRKSGEQQYWLEAHFSAIYSGDGKPVSAVISYTDVTEQLEKEAVYRKWQQSMRDKPPESYSLFRCNVSKDTVFDTSEGNLLHIQFSPGPFNFDQQTADYVAQCVFKDDGERFKSFLSIDSLLSGYYQGRRIVTIEYRERTEDNSVRWLRLTVDLVEHDHYSDIEAYLLFEDIDKQKRQELLTVELAETDPLTGIMNRATFAAQVNNHIATARPGSQHALMMLDIDGFKLVNDAFGHSAGDQVLIDIAGSLRTALRHGDLVGRLGGDEFVVFLTDIPGDVVTAAKARQICAMTRKSFSVDVEISGSIGIAVSPRDGLDFDALYKRADAALYHVKDSGKDSYSFYHDDMTDNPGTESENIVLPESEAKRKKKRRMLIVDDSRIDHALLANVFADDFTVEKARDGSSALIRMRHYGSSISVVLLDLVMPGMDGFAVLRKMRESAELRNVPVIVVSGDNNQETGLRAIREGAVDFVSKPVDPSLLRIRVQSAISKAENERLRAKNSLLELESGELERYRTALERNGIVVVENDWVAGTFAYDAYIANHIAGTYNDRSLWHILLSDLVAETLTVKKMQEMVQHIATDRVASSDRMLVQLKTPQGARHWFRMNVYKVVNEFGLAGKIYLTFVDLGSERLTDD